MRFSFARLTRSWLERVRVFSFVKRLKYRSLLSLSGLVIGQRWWAGPGFGRAGPAGRAGPSIFDMMGRGPAQPIKF